MILEIECMLIILYLRTKCNNPHDVTTSKEMNLGGGIQRSIVFSIRSLLQNLTRCNSIVTIFHSFVTYLCGQILTTINSKQRRATNYIGAFYLWHYLQFNHYFYCELYRSHAVGDLKFIFILKSWWFLKNTKRNISMLKVIVVQRIWIQLKNL